MNVKVENLRNINGNEVKNQYMFYLMVNGEHIKIFQSYNSEVLIWENGVLTRIGKEWNTSHTTMEYIKQLTGLNKKAFEKMLENDYIYDDFLELYKLK